jgi:hypothetical protein
MLDLREYRRRPARSGRLPALGGPGRAGRGAQQGRRFQRTAEFRGPDLDSATDAEVAAVAARLNGALRRLGSGWALFVEARRDPAMAYPTAPFPIPSRPWSTRSAAPPSCKAASTSRAATS